MCVSVIQLSLTLCDPMDLASQAPLSIEFSRHEYWSGLPFPFPMDLPNPGIEPASLALAGGFFSTEPPGKPLVKTTAYIFEADFQSTFLNLCLCLVYTKSLRSCPTICNTMD